MNQNFEMNLSQKLFGVIWHILKLALQYITLLIIKLERYVIALT